MSNEGDKELRPVVLLRRIGDRWQAGLPFLLPDWRSDPGDIAYVVAAARDAVGTPVGDTLTLKAVEDTELERDDVLALIEANGRASGLDLSGCTMTRIDLSRETIQRNRDAYRQTNGADPPWFYPRTAGVDLRGAQLQGANLFGAQLQGADLRWAQLQRAVFATAQLQGAVLEGSQLQGAGLSGAQLQGAVFENAQLRGAIFVATQLQRANFLGAALQGADLTAAQLDGADFRGAQLQGAVFDGAQLQEADLRGAQLQGVDLYNVKSLARAGWYGAFLDRTRIRGDRLGVAIGDEDLASEENTVQAYRSASEAYRILKNNFNSIGRYEDAAWSYVKEQRMEKAALRSELGGLQWQKGRFWDAAVSWLLNWLWDILTGYGQTPQKPVVLAIVVLFLFTGIYALAGNIAPDFAGDPATAEGSHSYLDALTHSIAAFATIGFNTLEPLGWGARLLTAIESALGIGLFALFVFTLGNRMSRS